MTDTNDLDLTPDRDTAKHGNRYWHEIEDTAFLIWFKHGRDPKVVVRMLEEDPVYRELAKLEDGDPIPNVQTIKRWIASNFWEVTAMQRMKEMVPYQLEHAALEIAYGAKDAATSLMRIARGENVTREDRTVMDAASRVLGMSIGQSVSDKVKAHVQHKIDIGELETMADVLAYEEKLRQEEGQGG